MSLYTGVLGLLLRPLQEQHLLFMLNHSLLQPEVGILKIKIVEGQMVGIILSDSCLKLRKSGQWGQSSFCMITLTIHIRNPRIPFKDRAHKDLTDSC